MLLQCHVCGERTACRVLENAELFHVLLTLPFCRECAPRSGKAWEALLATPALEEWSDDCLGCLANLPHSRQAHHREVEKAQAEWLEENALLERETRAYWKEDAWVDDAS
ncbi:MAG TPA: hypothetical protein VKR06_41555 [Ktedonosporobacter sp.]|nr:hypothetical protein [Ktedonosporobacter sp.]